MTIPAARHREARRIIDAAATEFHGALPDLATRQLYQAVAAAETSYGRGTYRGGVKVPNNWGAVQCTDAQEQSGVTCVEAADTTQTGAEYPQSFRAYPTPHEGAVDMIRLIRAFTGPAPYSTIANFSDRLYGYYGARCPGCVKAHGVIEVERAMRRRAYGTVPGACCRAEAVAQHVGSLDAWVEEIAAAEGETRVPRSGAARGFWWLLAVGGAGFAVAKWRKWI